jgi:hypothetical protein
MRGDWEYGKRECRKEKLSFLYFSFLPNISMSYYYYSPL